jgi:hypothetical protein
MLKPKECKPSCVHCRIHCHEYRISDNGIKLEKYEELAKECKFYTEVLPNGVK